MIYIFQGCQGICSLPGYACQACGEACKSCPSVCNACSEACRGCGNQFKHLMEKPLSAYVVVSVLVSIYAILMAQSGLSEKKCSSTYLLIVEGFAVINTVFAVYVLHAVWNKIDTIENRQDRWVNGDRPPAGIAPHLGAFIIPSDLVQESFKKVFMEDLLVLLMFFGLLGMFCLSAMGPQYVDGHGGNVCDSSAAKGCGYLFFWIAACFSLAYMKCSCCSSKVVVKKDEHELNAEFIPSAPPGP